VLTVRGLRIASLLGGRERTIVDGVDLDVGRGETLGIVGESGSGKSMTARAIVGLLPPGVRAQGEVRLDGQQLLGAGERALRRVRGTRIALVLQDPFAMLDPLLRCGDQVVDLLRDERGRALGRRARRAEAQRRLAEVGIEDPTVADARPFELSGGLCQRVAIAAALARDPEVLIADEPATALDLTTQREVLGQLAELRRSRGMSLVLITHDLRVAFSLCDAIAVLYAGSVLERAGADALGDEPRHPYTLGLLLSEPPADRRLERLAAIEGSVPDPDEVGPRCLFAARCRWRQERCLAGRPPLVEVGAGRASACVRQAEIAPDLRRLREAAGRQAPAMALGGEPGPALLEAREVVKRFGDGRPGRRRVQALAGVSLEVAAGESVGLVGESGAGKTTLARCLLGLERPSAGAIVIDGIDAGDWATLGPGERERLRRTVQMVFQDPASTLNPARTVRATLSEALAMGGPRSRDRRREVARLLERVGLPASYAARKPAALSGGERQRVAVARALAVGPRVLVCDEPVSALDVSVQAQILNLLADVRRELGVALLLIAHDLAVVRQVTERVYVLRRGEVVESGPTDEVLDRPRHPYTRSLIEATPRADGTWPSFGGSPSAV
jgi:peptide/nickel transport system ATP-binding protein